MNSFFTQQQLQALVAAARQTNFPEMMRGPVEYHPGNGHSKPLYTIEIRSDEQGYTVYKQMCQAFPRTRVSVIVNALNPPAGTPEAWYHNAAEILLQGLAIAQAYSPLPDAAIIPAIGPTPKDVPVWRYPFTNASVAASQISPMLYP